MASIMNYFQYLITLNNCIVIPNEKKQEHIF